MLFFVETFPYYDIEKFVLENSSVILKYLRDSGLRCRAFYKVCHIMAKITLIRAVVIFIIAAVMLITAFEMQVGVNPQYLWYCH